jgi:putative serine protease PepD
MSHDAADDDRPRGLGERSGDAADDSRYFGPFASRPSFDEPAPPSAYASAPGNPAPSPGMSPGMSPWPAPGPPPPPSRPVRGGAGVLIAAILLALVVGGAAGFGGSRLADLTATPGGATSPSAVDPGRTEPAPSDTAPSDPAPTEPAPSQDPTSQPPAPAPTTAPPDPTRPRQIDTVGVARSVLPGTVMIQAGAGDEGSTGSGFLIDAAGRIITNNHVVARAASGGRITVTFADGRRSAATLVGRSASYDIAVIKVAASRQLRPLPLGDSDAAQIGEPVVAVGSPLGLPGTVTQGIISAKNRPVVVDSEEEADAASAYISGIQTDAPINPGNSGGPLIDAGGRVIGVNSAILTLGGQTQTGNIGLGFAIPVKQATAIAKELIKDGKATYPVIGANVGRESARGVELGSVEAGGPAARAGLRDGDLVTRIDRLPVSTGEALIVAIRTHRPGEKVTLSYSRGSSRGRAVVTLGSREG